MPTLVKTAATLAGVPLIGDAPVSWSLSPGTSPQRGVFFIAEEFVERIRLELRNRVRLEIRIDDSSPLLRVDHLYMLSLVSGGAPWRRGILVADRRWRWPKTHIRRSYNLRRRMGNRRLIQTNELGAVETVATVAYAAFSLRGETTPWTASEILRDVMAELEPATDVKIPDFRQQLPVENLELNDDGASALARVLQHIPGVTCTVDPGGNVVFYDAIDAKQEETVATESGFQLAPDRGFLRPTESPLMRPRKVNVFFQREIEVRFDSAEGADIIAPGGITGLRNVLPITDPTLAVEGRTLAQGTWITVDQAIAAWNASGLPPKNPGPLSLSMIRQLWNPEWDGLQINYGNFGAAADAIWTARVSMLKAHYRQTFRLPREWMDRIYELRANRVAILDPTTGARAPAQAWSDYCVVPSARAKEDSNFPDYGVNVVGYATRINTKRVAPIPVQVVDSEQGIIRLDYRTDPGGFFSGLFPGSVTNMPTADPSNRTRRPRWWSEAPGRHHQGVTQLAETYQCATILTVVPGAPNGRGQMAQVSISAQEAADTLRQAGADHRILPADGPELDVYIGPGVATARYAWVDDDGWAGVVERAFGLFGGDGTFGRPGAWMNEIDCRAIAKAAAAVAYSSAVERLQGEKSVALNPRTVPRGTIQGVTHTLLPSGEATTTLVLPAAAQAQRSLFTLLPDHVRAKIMRLVQP